MAGGLRMVGWVEHGFPKSKTFRRILTHPPHPPHPPGRALRFLWLVLLISFSMTISTIGPASAQVVADEPDEEQVQEADEEEFKGVEEMMVEARRRSENIQKIGESVSSFSDMDILDAGLTNFNDLQYNVPSLFSGGGLTKITLRGVGSEIVGPGVDPGFSVHVNGVFSAREGTGLINFFDIERVDVLRGPQGTLWGRNSTGGALNVVTKKAEHEFGAEATAQYEWFKSDADGFLITGMLNMPIVEDKLALRVSLLTTMDDGQFQERSENHSQRVGDAAATAMRASLRWEPNEDVTVDLVGSWLRSNGAGAGRKFAGEFAAPATDPINIVGAGPGIDFTGALPNPSNPYKGTSNEPQRSDATVWTATMLIAWEADDFTLDSIN
jgi:iron complex outermembrane receptor protein